ncbi:hypothetical protein ACOKFD_06910 [Flagellimonas sp. S174]|uniref:hypothetical protein n=1 Tax=Flagellimonas sp. S174 TaxID=3410790 RepID=UPI003BF53AB4
MNKITIILALCFVGMLSCKAQTPVAEDKAQEIWYTYTMSGDLGSCTIYEDKMVFNSPVGSDSKKGISLVILEKRLDSLHLVIRNDKKTPPYAVMSLRKQQDVLKMAPVLTGTSVADVEKKFLEGQMPNWISLTEQYWYTKEKIAQMEEAPGLDELKREDLLTAMMWRNALSEKLQQYLEETGGERSFMIYRFVEAYRNQKLIELGYNPYKRVVYNLRKTFANDQEIMKLLNEEIKF